ncbi:MAG: aspartate-semialdehyde dehydrogenase [Chloroflexi bacterium]|nr:aspartate-semialdehyde dehydrogenase [Chloroflexota bacterium]
MSGYRVAVVGAAGLVTQELVKILERRGFPTVSLRLFAPDRFASHRALVDHRDLVVEELNTGAFEEVDLAFFATGADVARYYAPLAVKAGAIVVDLTPAWRMDPEVPLVVPEINAADLRTHRGIIASPEETTVALTLSLYPLHRVNPLKRIVVATYESVSSAGSAALEELSTQARLVMEGRTVVPHVFPHQVAFNVLPEVDVFLDNGYSRGEWKLVEETRKVLHVEGLLITATCVRVPVFVGHAVAVHAEFSQFLAPEDARKLLVEFPGVRVLDDPGVSLYPQPWSAGGTDEVLVGRVRRDASNSNGLALWVVVDNLRKGTALNAVQIAEDLVRRGQVPEGGKRHGKVGAPSNSDGHPVQ